MVLKRRLLTKLFIPVIFLSLLVLLQQSCKKVDFSRNKEEITDKTERFFNLPTNLNNALQRVADELKTQNDNKEFIKEFIANEGFAIWDKASISVKTPQNNSIANYSSSTGIPNLSGYSDTTIFIPLVLNNENHVNAFIVAKVTDTVSMRLFRQGDYKNFPFQTATPSPITTAENYALHMMQMDKDLFGHTVFEIKDKRLFNNSRAYKDTFNIRRIIDFVTTANSNTANTSSAVQLVCVTITTTTTVNHCPYSQGQCTGPNGTCDNCPSICANVSSTNTTQCESWNEYEEGNWPTLPTGGGGGNSGGNGPPCPNSPFAPIVNSVIPANCNPIPNPWPPVISIFNNLSNPINVPDDTVIQLGGIEIGNIQTNTVPPIRRIGKTPNRNNTEDMTYGNNCDASGILTNLQNLTDAQLFSGMASLLHDCTIMDQSLRAVGDDMIQKFQDKTGGSFTDPTLSQRTFESSAFKNFIKRFGIILNQKLANANWNINNVNEIDIPNEIRPKFNGTYNKFHGLQILVNDTEQTEIELNNFWINPVSHKWTASITVKIKDHFGLDKHDALTYQNNHAGFAAWWILQHCRGYKPFETNLKINLNLISDPANGL